MMLQGGEPVLSAGAVGQMTRDQLTPEQRAGIGEGFLEGRSWGLCQSVVTEGPRAGDLRMDGGLGTSWLADPKRDLTVIVLTQRMFESPRAAASPPRAAGGRILRPCLTAARISRVSCRDRPTSSSPLSERTRHVE